MGSDEATGRFKDQVDDLSSKLEVFSFSCADKDSKIKNLMNTNLNLQSQLAEFNSVKEVSNTLEMQLSDAPNQHEEFKKVNMELTDKLEEATDKILELEDKVHKANEQAHELMIQLEEADQKINGMKSELNKRVDDKLFYNPVHGDVVD